jgi:hypothetical protein
MWRRFLLGLLPRFLLVSRLLLFLGLLLSRRLLGGRLPRRCLLGGRLLCACLLCGCLPLRLLILLSPRLGCLPLRLLILLSPQGFCGLLLPSPQGFCGLLLPLHVFLLLSLPCRVRSLPRLLFGFLLRSPGVIQLLLALLILPIFLLPLLLR